MSKEQDRKQLADTIAEYDDKIIEMNRRMLNDRQSVLDELASGKCPIPTELLKGVPIGMFHCELCGTMCVAGIAADWEKVFPELNCGYNVRSLALALLDDEHGISEVAWIELCGLLAAEGTCEDIISTVRTTEGRVYLQESQEPFPS